MNATHVECTTEASVSGEVSELVKIVVTSSPAMSGVTFSYSAAKTASLTLS